MTDRCWDGVVSPRGCPRKGVGKRVTSALRLELTYRSSQAMRIPAILLFYIYIFYFRVWVLCWDEADRCRKWPLFPTDCGTLASSVAALHVSLDISSSVDEHRIAILFSYY
jgi:hypothetical protein